MQRVCFGVGIVMLAASTGEAGTICTYSTSYNDPDIGGPCFVDAVEGCPVHVVLPHEPPPVELMPAVYRDGQSVTVTSTTSVIGSVDATFSNFDYYSCDCQRVTDTVSFDEIEMTITGARAGDVVSLLGGEITIEPASTCAPPVWPTEFDVQLGGCDPCPIDSGRDSGSCGTTTGGSLIPGLIALVIAVNVNRRRRRRP